MWNITKQAKENFLKRNLLPIHETDHEWEIVLREAKEEGEDLFTRLKEELEEVKTELLQILPSRFIPYVKDGTLNQPILPKAVRDDYLQWIQEGYKEFERILDAASDQTRQAIAYLPTAVQEIFAESLHDSVIERIEREKDRLHLYVNTDGGFSTKALIHFIFKAVTSEETDEPLQVGQWLIYDELQKTDDGFAFRVLFDCPEAEWTITMNDLDAEYFHRPKEFYKLLEDEKLEETSWTEYVGMLNSDQRYWFITPHMKATINALSENIELDNGMIDLGPDEMVVAVGDERFSYDLSEYNPIKFIYTDVYEEEDPHAQLIEPIPTEEIEAAIFSDDLEWQVRAWNTMYTNPTELADIINHILRKMELTEENEMLLSIYLSHFYDEGILQEAVIQKYRLLLE